MPPKTKKSAKDSKKQVSAPELYPLAPVNYLTNDIRTSIELFSTDNEEIKLRAIGRVHKCLADSPEFLDYVIRQGLHPKFIKLLKTENVYILRFAMDALKLITAKPEAWLKLLQGDLYGFCDLTRHVFLEFEDPLLKDKTAEVVLRLLKLLPKTVTVLCTKEVISRLFELMKTTETLETQETYLRIFYYLLESTEAEALLLGTPNFSIELLLCFLRTEEHPLKPLVVDIVHKIAVWKRPEYLKELCEKKTMEVVTDLLLENVQEYRRTPYEILYCCLQQEGADVQYSKTLEFLKFLEWARSRRDRSLSIAANIITLMSRNDALHQVRGKYIRFGESIGGLLQLLLDFGIDEVLMCLLRNYQEKVLGNLCESINNLTRHMHMCYKMTNVDLMTTLIDILSDRNTSMVPYGELVLKTLHRFFQCNHQTVHVVCESQSLNNLLKTFYDAPKDMTQGGFLAFLEIMQIIVRSKYVVKLLDISLYTALVDLFKTSEDVVLEKVLGLIKDLMVFKEFRDYFLENDGINMLAEKLDSANYATVYGTLLLVKYFMKFKKPACFFLDIGIVGRLLELHEKLKTKTNLCDEILQTLFDLCLTVKFFYTGSLSVKDRIRDQFYLIPDELVKSQKKEDEVQRLTYDTPIYVVLYGSLMKFRAFKLQLPPGGGDEVERQQSTVTAQFKRATKYCINLVPSVLAMKFAHQICKDELLKEQQGRLFVQQHRKKCEDERLALYIREVYEELTFNKLASARTQDKISFIARYVAQHLDDFRLPPGKEGNERHLMNMHLIHLKDVLKSNFIPIGYLRKGMTRERALLFKVICDQMNIPASLNRHTSGVFWNGVTFIKSNPRSSSDAIISVEFIVDLIANVGELIPVHTNYANKYFEYFSKF